MIHPPEAVTADATPRATADASDRATGTLRFVATAADATAANRAAASATIVVLDTTWTSPVDASADSRVISVRDVAAGWLSEHDLIAETSERLDRWAAGSTVIERMTIGETSFWFYVRLRHWMWLQERILWAAIVDALVRRLRPARIEAGSTADPALVDCLRLVAKRDGIRLDVESHPAAAEPAVTRSARPKKPPAPARAAKPSIVVLLRRSIRRRIQGPPPPPAYILRRMEVAARIAKVAEHVAALEADSRGRLLVVQEHASQVVETPDGRRTMNPYLDPIVDRLRRGVLDPIVLDIRALAGRDADWERLGAGDDPSHLPADALSADRPPPAEPETPPGDPAKAAGSSALGLPQRAERPPDPAIAAWRTQLRGAIDASGLDLGPLLAAEVADAASRWLPGMTASIERIERFLRRIRPAAILLADEYHRQDWMEAARRLAIPVAAIQHGLIYPHHNGYIHATRPPTLRLPQRTYVFGRWERDLLVERSVYRPDEVVVGGSPRLDLVTVDPDAPRLVRAELGVGPDDRLVVVSGTWGGLYRRFHYPIALAALVDRPLDGVRFVVKLHPGEPDEGPYAAILASSAAAHGVATPRVETVRAIDLYRLLAAADAHLGIHSTVLTEAVVTRTPNLLAEGVAGADLIGYLEAGVALPVRDGASFLAALDAAAAGAIREGDSAAFVAAHFEPGGAADRIAADLRAWVAGGSAASAAAGAAG